MSQMDSGDILQERQVPPSYGHYEGNPQYGEYGGTSSREQSPSPSSMYDDEFVDAFAQRLSQRMAQGPQGKLHSRSKSDSNSKASAGQRLALAIVSVISIMMFTAIILTSSNTSLNVGVGVLLGGAYLAIFLINAVFNEK